MTRYFRAALTAVLTTVVAVGMGLAAVPSAQAETNIYHKAAKYLVGGEYENFSFYPDPNIGGGMTDSDRSDVNTQVGEMTYSTYVAQLDYDVAKRDAHGRTNPQALYDAIEDVYPDADLPMVTAVMTGTHIDAEAFGNFKQAFKDDLQTITDDLNDDPTYESDPLGLIQEWISQVDNRMSGSRVDGSDTDDGDEPEPTATVTTTETATATATATATVTETATAKASASHSGVPTASDDGTGHNLTGKVVGGLAVAVLVGLIVWLIVKARREAGDHE